MLMQHIGVGYFGYYRATAYAMKHSLMPEIAKLRMKALNFWDKHGIRAATDAFDVWRHCSAERFWKSSVIGKRFTFPGLGFCSRLPACGAVHSRLAGWNG